MRGRRGVRRGGRIFPRFSVQEDVAREIRVHIEMRAEELESEGWDPAAAGVEARRLFGDSEEVARKCRAITASHQRAVRRTKTMDAIWQDVRYAARTLTRSPGFALVALLTLALGIGANTAIFSVVNGILLRPLPYDRPEQLVWVSEINTRGRPMAVAWPNFVDWREESTSFAGLSPLSNGTTTVLGGEEPVRASLATVGQDFWKIFPVQPLRGRLTTPEDHVPGAAPVVVVSRSFWQNELGGRDLDRYTLEVQGMRLSVVGVLPDDFDFPEGTQMWAPAEPQNQSLARSAHNWRVVGRLAPGVGLDRAREEIDAITKRVVAQATDEDPDYLATGALTVPLSDQLLGDVREPLFLLLGAAALVLLVACTNLASTLLARGAARERELAVRASLGAGRGRILTQLLTESLLLSLVGAAAGVGLAALVLRGLRAAAPGFLPRVGDVGIDGTVLLFTAAVAVITALLFGLLPARRLSGTGAGEALRSGSRGNAMDGRASVWRLLVGTEVALALVLLAGSALLVRSFRTLLSEDPGFDASDVDVIAMSLSQIKYATAEDDARFYDRFLRELEALPGVSAVGVLSRVPTEGAPNGRLELDGDLDKLADGEYVVASAGAFEALDIPLLEGRLFDDRDGPDDAHVAIVNRSFAQKYWPNEDPVGKSVTGGGMDNFYSQRIFARVVGVVGDVRQGSLGREPYPTVYFPYTQRPFRVRYGASVVVEAANGDAAGLTSALRDRLRAADPDVPVRIGSLGGLVRASLGERRFVMLVLGGFSLTALILAGVGIFGVVSYSVARRTREMGIRVALGADPGGVVRLVMAAAMRMVMAGLIVGVVGALVVTRIMRSLLYQVSPTDPWALGAATLLLGGAALLASWLPARAGTRVDPMITMRAE